MKQEEMLALAEKIKSGQATEEEKVAFFQNFEILIKDLNEDLKQLQP